MKKDLKAHLISNIITFVGILLSFFIISYSMLFGERYHSFDAKQDEAFSLTCKITFVEKEITEEQAKNVLKGYKELATENSINYAGIESITGQEKVTTSDVKQGTEILSSDNVDNVCKLINNTELCFLMRDSKSLQATYKKLTELCSNNGFEIEIYDQKEINERQTAVVEKRIYDFIQYGSMIFSTLLLFISIFLWFDKRKREWFIRNICGQSVKELLIESTKIILLFIVVVYIITILTLSIYKPASIVNIIKYGFVGFVEAIICMLLLSVKYSKIAL